MYKALYPVYVFYTANEYNSIKLFIDREESNGKGKFPLKLLIGLESQKLASVKKFPVLLYMYKLKGTLHHRNQCLNLRD